MAPEGTVGPATTTIVVVALPGGDDYGLCSRSPQPSVMRDARTLLIALLAALALAGALGMAYRMRVRQLENVYHARLEERWAERSRMARELHDRLLQEFQGLMFHLQAVRDLLPEEPGRAVPVLDLTLLKGEEVIDEARKAVGELRSSEQEVAPYDSRPAAVAYRRGARQAWWRFGDRDGEHG